MKIRSIHKTFHVAKEVHDQVRFELKRVPDAPGEIYEGVVPDEVGDHLLDLCAEAKNHDYWPVEKEEVVDKHEDGKGEDRGEDESSPDPAQGQKEQQKKRK